MNTYYIEREVILNYITWHVMFDDNVIASFNKYTDAVDFILFMGDM